MVPFKVSITTIVSIAVVGIIFLVSATATGTAMAALTPTATVEIDITVIVTNNYHDSGYSTMAMAAVSTDMATLGTAMATLGTVMATVTGLVTYTPRVTVRLASNRSRGLGGDGTKHEYSNRLNYSDDYTPGYCYSSGAGTA